MDNRIFSSNKVCETESFPLPSNKESSSSKTQLLSVNTTNSYKSLNFRVAIVKDTTKKQSCWVTTKKKIYKLIESNVSQLLIIVLSCFSVINDDLRLCALSLKVDSSFYVINEFIFIFFFVEFVLLCICNSKFINTFYFWIDLVSIISLIPETHFIWTPIQSLLVGSEGNVDDIVQSGRITNASKASAFGAKTSKLLKLIKIVSFINVIRVAKMVEATRSLSKQKTKFAIKQIKEIKREFQNKNRRRNMFHNAIADTVKLSIKYNDVFDPNKDKPFSKRESLEKNEGIPSKRVSIKLSDKFDIKSNRISYFVNSDLFVEDQPKLINKLSIKKQGEKKITTKLRKIKTFNEQQIDSYKRKMTREDMSENSNDNDKMSNGEEMKLNEKIERNRRLINDNIFCMPYIPEQIFEEKEENLTPDLLEVVDNKVRNEHKLLKENSNFRNSESNISMYSSLRNFKMEDNERELLNFHTNLLVLNDNKTFQKKNTINSFKRGNTIKSERSFKDEKVEENKNIDEVKEPPNSHNNHSDSSDSEEENNKKKILKTKNILLNGKKFKLEENLSEMIIRKVVLIVLAIIVVSPMLDIGLLQDFIYSQNELLSKNVYCYDMISKFIKASKKDPVFIKGLRLTLNHCFTNAAADDDTFIALINFTNLGDYVNLTLDQQGSRLPMELKIDNLDKYLTSNRENSYYINLTNYENSGRLTIIYDNSIESRLLPFLNLIKSFVVGVVLIYSAILFNKDVINYVISPLDKIFSRVQYHLKHFDNNVLVEEENEIISQTSIHNSTNDLSEKQKKKLETYLIEMTFKKLVFLLQVSIGKPVLMLIPNSDLNTNIITVNCNNPGFSFEGVFLSIQIKNTDKFVKEYQENAYIFINKIYYLFHSIGSIFLGDIAPGGNFIVWKKREDFFKSLEDYSNLITNFDEKHIEENSIKIIKDCEIKDPAMNHFMNLAVISGIKFITSLYKEIFEFSEITTKYNIKIVLVAEMGKLFHGYFSTVQKLNNLIIGNELNDAVKLSEKYLSDFGKPALYVSQNLYNKLDTFLKKNIYQTGILFNKRLNTKTKIYKQFINFNKIDKMVSADKVNKKFSPLSVNNILKKRKDLENLLLSESFLFEDILLYDSSTRELITEFPTQFKVLISYSLNKLSKEKYDVSLSTLEDLSTIDCPDNTIKLMIKELIQIVEKIKQSKSTSDYTILYKE